MADSSLTLRTAFNHFVREYYGAQDAKKAPLTWTKDVQGDGSLDVGEVEVTKSFAAQLGLKGTTTTTAHNAPIVAKTLQSLRSKMETTRRELVQGELAPNVLKDVEFRYDPSKLPVPAQQALPLLLEINALTEDLRLLQIDARGVDWRLEVASQSALSGDGSAKLFGRGAITGCRFDKSPLCHPLASFPTADPNTSIWPDFISFDESVTSALQARPDSKAILSPFTSIKGNRPSEKAAPSEWNLKATAYQQDPLYRPTLLQIADRFEKIANIPGFAKIEPDMHKVALAYAKAIRDGKGNAPWDAAEMIWAKAEGKHIAWAWGPLEEGDPSHKKRIFQMHVFMVRQEDTSRYQKVLPAMEQALAARTPSYKARPVSSDSVVQVYDVIARSGGINMPQGEVLAEVLPNTGPVQDQGIPKRQIFANIGEAVFDTIGIELAKLAIDPAQVHLVRGRSFTASNAGHENAHAIGPKADLMVEKDGKMVSADVAMGTKLRYYIEEAKADLAGIMMFKHLHDMGLATQEEVESLYVTYVMGRIRQMRFGGAHGGGSAAQFGAMFDTGVLEFIPVTINGQTEHRIHVNTEKMYEFALSHAAQITESQTLGSQKLAQAFMDNAKKIPARFNEEFVPRFINAGIPRHIKLQPKAVSAFIE